MIRKKKKHFGKSTQQFMGVKKLTSNYISTEMGDLVFFILKPSNLSVLPESSIEAKVHALVQVLSNQADIEMIALNSRESFERNKYFYERRLELEDMPALRNLLQLDLDNLDQLQMTMASSREFYLVVRLHGITKNDVFSFLSNLEQHISSCGFMCRRADTVDFQRMLATYFEQNIVADRFEDYDGQWEMEECKHES